MALALGSAFSFSLSTALKHRSAQLIAPVGAISGRSFGRFIVATVRHRLWIAGGVCDIAGLVLQISALHIGQLAIVQPLLLTGLVFSLAFSAIGGRGHGRRPIGWNELAWAGAICGCLAALFALGGSTGATLTEPPDRLPAVVSAVAGAILTIGALIVGRRKRDTSYGPALIGVAVGTLYASTAALLKGLSDIAARNPWSLLTSWQLYAVVVAGALGLLASQLAFQSSPLSASLPAIATVDPLLSVVIGVVIFDEHLQAGGGRGAGLLVLLLLLTVGVARLIRAGNRRELLTKALAEPSPSTEDERRTHALQSVGMVTREGG
ncbi:MAG: hypothetical protein JWM76_2413 [Pseudonocardiales bacterium]|nr:hypothetical protein [Pseudonocardiales bacterium]